MELWESKDKSNTDTTDTVETDTAAEEAAAGTDAADEAQAELAAGVSEAVEGEAAQAAGESAQGAAEAVGDAADYADASSSGASGAAVAGAAVAGAAVAGAAAAGSTMVAEAAGTELAEDAAAEVAEEVITAKSENKFVKGLKKAGIHLWYWIKRHKILTVLLVLLLIAAIVLLILFNRRQQATQMMTMDITVETATIETMDLSNSVGVTGTIYTANSFTGTTTLSNIEVTEVYVELGDEVEEGDIICTFDSSDLEEALAEAESNYSINQQLDALEDSAEDIYNETVENAADQLEELQENVSSTRSTYVSAAEATEEAAEDLAEAQSALSSAQSAYESATQALKTAIVNYDNAVTDGNSSFSSANDVNDIDGYLNNISDINTTDYNTYLKSAVDAYNTALSNYNSAQSAVSDAQTAYSSAQQTESSACNAYESAVDALSDYEDTYDETLENAYTTYQKSVLQEELTSDDDLLSQISDYEDQIDDCIVYAGMSGTITSLNVSAGEVFSGGSIYEIQDTEYFIVEATVDEYDIVDIEEGQTAYVVTDATGDEELAAEVTYVAVTGTSGSSMGSVSGTAAYEIEITITEPQTLIRSGMSASVSIALEESLGCLAVPYDCVQTNAAGESVIYVDMNGQQTEVVVETGIETDYYTEVISDEIYEGMTVYLTNSLLVSSGSTVLDAVEDSDSSDDEDASSILDSLTGGGGDSGGGSMPSGGGDMPSGGGGGGMGGGF